MLLLASSTLSLTGKAQPQRIPSASPTSSSSSPPRLLHIRPPSSTTSSTSSLYLEGVAVYTSSPNPTTAPPSSSPMSATPTAAALTRLRVEARDDSDRGQSLDTSSSSSSTSSPASLLSSASTARTSAASTPSSSSLLFSASSSLLPSPSSVLTSPFISPVILPSQSAISRSPSSNASFSLVAPYYDPELFTTPPPDHLLCAICTGVVHSPLNLSCSHLFCAACLAQWCQAQAHAQIQQADQLGGSAIPPIPATVPPAPLLSQSSQPPVSPSPASPSPNSSPLPIPSHHCPTCRVPFSLFLASPNHAIQHVIANMEVRCPNYEVGCPVRLQMGLRERNVVAHRRSCPWEKVKCRYAPECRYVGERREMGIHERTECKERMKECEECGELVKCGEWEDHKNSPLGCVGLTYCPHRCRTDPPTLTSPTPHSTPPEDEMTMGVTPRKKGRMAEEEKEHSHTPPLHIQLPPSSAGDRDPHSPSVTSVHSSSTPPSSATSSPAVQSPIERTPSSPLPLFVSAKRKFGTMTNPPAFTAIPPPPSTLGGGGSLTVLRRSALAAHLTVCPLGPIQCDLCPARILRSELESHFQANLTSHLLALQRSHRTEVVRTELLMSEVGQLRKDNSEMRKEVMELRRQVCSGPLFAFFFDIAPISLLCSHYISNDFVCGDHIYYFALHRQGGHFSAYLYLKTGTTPVRLSFVLMVKQRKAHGVSPVAPHTPESRVEGDVDALMEHEGVVVPVALGSQPSSLSPVTSFISSNASSSFSSPSASQVSSSPVSLRVKMDVEYKAAEGKGVSHWFTLQDLTERGGYSAEEDAITIGVLIKDHSSAWVYSAADALYPPGPVPSLRLPPAARSGLDQ